MDFWLKSTDFYESMGCSDLSGFPVDSGINPLKNIQICHILVMNPWRKIVLSQDFIRHPQILMKSTFTSHPSTGKHR